MKETKTFTLGERVKVSSYGDYEDIRYCSYCGIKANRKDVGSSHNHRWEENIIFYCTCENAKKDAELKSKISEHKNKLFYLERDLKEMEKLENNETVNAMKYAKELNDLKIKFKMK